VPGKDPWTANRFDRPRATIGSTGNVAPQAVCPCVFSSCNFLRKSYVLSEKLSAPRDLPVTTIEQLLTSPPVTVVATAPAAPPASVAVLHIINGEHYAGAERVQDLLGQQLPNLGYRPGFVCLKNGQFAAMRKSADSPLYDVAMSGRADFSPVGRLSRIVRDEGYRLIHTHTARSALIGCAVSWRTAVPMVHHVHSLTSCDTTHRFRNWMNCLVERIVLRRARAIIAVSEAVGDYVREQGFGVHVVPNGVPRRQTVPPRDPAKRDWTLGMIALFRPRKGLEMLLEALAELRRRGLPVRLRAVGAFETPEYEAQIRRLADQLQLDSAIDWTGFARDIDAEMARMDLFVLPSLFGEGLPMVVLEAMSAGLPVVASAVSGVPEAIRDGVEGLLVEPSNPAALVDAIARVVNGQVSWQALSSGALLRHAERFSDVRMAAEVAGVYDWVLNPLH
jgi:glycosyltransferase involved in cell wall biosynthesis